MLKTIEKYPKTTSHKNNEIINHYFNEWVIGVNSDLTIDAKKNDIKKFIIFFNYLNGDLCLSHWTSLDTKKFLTEMEKQSYSPASINRTLATLKSLANFMVEEKYLSASPTRRIKGPIEDSPPYLNLTDIEIHRLRKAAQVLTQFKTAKYHQPFRDKIILELFLGTGLRCSELANLQLNQLQERKLVGVKCKGYRYRDIVIKKSLANEINIFISRHRVNGISNNIFTSFQGVSISRRTVYNILQKIAAQANSITKDQIHLYPHLLRHVHGKRVRDKFGDCYTAKRLGHANNNYVERYAGYSELEEAKMIEDLEV